MAKSVKFHARASEVRFSNSLRQRFVLDQFLMSISFGSILLISFHPNDEQKGEPV